MKHRFMTRAEFDAAETADDLRIILSAILSHLDSDPVELRLACAAYVRTRDAWPVYVRGIPERLP